MLCEKHLSLGDMVMLSDKEFATQITDITVENIRFEYAVFLGMDSFSPAREKRTRVLPEVDWNIIALAAEDYWGRRHACWN